MCSSDLSVQTLIEKWPVGIYANFVRISEQMAVSEIGQTNIPLLSVSIWSGADGPTRGLFHWLSALIALPVIAYAGRPFFDSARMALSHRRTNMDVPISIGVTLATASDAVATLVTKGLVVKQRAEGDARARQGGLAQGFAVVGGKVTGHRHRHAVVDEVMVC